MSVIYCTKCGQRFSTDRNVCPRCGAQKLGSEPSLIAVDKSGQVAREYPLTRPQCSIGSDPSNDLVVTDSTVSRRHALLTRSIKSYQLTDLGSTNGTYVDGYRISAPTALRDGVDIRFGNAPFLFREHMPVIGETARVMTPDYGANSEVQAPRRGAKEIGYSLLGVVVIAVIWLVIKSIADSSSSSPTSASPAAECAGCRHTSKKSI